MIGKTISHYKILEHLGAGGMGVIYKAQDLRLGRLVALKFLPPEWSRDEAAKRRFIQEAQAASSLDHPNVINIHEIDETEDGQLFIAMAYYDGETLLEKLVGGPLAVEQALAIAVQTAEGLTQAHAQGIFHRDIKPANLMITREGVVKILDFGLAKFAGQLRMTKVGVTLGTVAYMSPEQARGEPTRGATDIWSLGAVLYEMLSGELPFKGGNEQAIIYSILHQEVTPLRQVASGVPPALDRVVLKALAREPGERYPRMADLLEGLKRARAELEFGATLSRPSVVGKLDLRRAYRYGLGALALLLALLGGAYLWRAKETKDSTPPAGARRARAAIAVLPLKDLSGKTEEDYLADGMTEALITDLSKISALRVISRGSVMRFKLGDTPVSEIARELNVGAVVEGSVLPVGRRIRVTAQLVDPETRQNLWADSYERTLSDILVLQGELAQTIAREIKVRLTSEEAARLGVTRRVDPEAHEAYLRGRFFTNQRTEASLGKAIAQYRRSIEIEPTAEAYAGLADAYSLLGFYSNAPPGDTYPQAELAARKALSMDETLAEAHASLALVQNDYHRDWTGAEQSYRRAIELNPSYATAHHWYGTLLSALGRHQEALAALERAREHDPLSLIINANRGWMLYHAREYQPAIEQYRKTLELGPDFPVAHYYLGVAYEQTGRLAEAIAALKKAVELSGGAPYAVAGLAHAYALSGRRREAEEVVARLQDEATRHYVPSIWLAWALSGLRERDPVFAYLERAFDERHSDIAFLQVEPVWDSLRWDPRFVALLRRLNLRS